jgi:hypothetical protein
MSNKSFFAGDLNPNLVISFLTPKNEPSEQYSPFAGIRRHSARLPGFE